MDYFTGVRQKETLEISELLGQAKPGQKVKVNGAVHAIRDMGVVAFVILRKREGLLQGVYEEGTEGGANIFKLDYFRRPAVLAQSPQFYKQMMVGVFDRVFETAPVFRAEKHNTKRHLNEYTSLDFEMGYIDGFEDIMAMETGYLQYAMEMLEKDYGKELRILDITLPDVQRIPAVKFHEIKGLVSEKYGHQMRNPFDLEPEEELLIGRYAKLHNMYKKTRKEGFGAEVKRRIMLGSFVLSSGYYDAYYLKALKTKALIKEAFDRAFARFDVIIAPAAPTTALKLGHSLSDPLKMYLGDIYTVSVNLAGLPGISVPVGLDSKGLPVGMQILGNCFEENKIIRAAYTCMYGNARFTARIKPEGSGICHGHWPCHQLRHHTGLQI